MAIVLYVGGSKDGDRGVVPYGFSKAQAETDLGPELYFERFVDLQDGGRVRVMALENLHEDVLRQRTSLHLHRRRDG